MLTLIVYFDGGTLGEADVPVSVQGDGSEVTTV